MKAEDCVLFSIFFSYLNEKYKFINENNLFFQELKHLVKIYHSVYSLTPFFEIENLKFDINEYFKFKKASFNEISFKTHKILTHLLDFQQNIMSVKNYRCRKIESLMHTLNDVSISCNNINLNLMKFCASRVKEFSLSLNKITFGKKLCKFLITIFNQKKIAYERSFLKFDEYKYILPGYAVYTNKTKIPFHVLKILVLENNSIIFFVQEPHFSDYKLNKGLFDSYYVAPSDKKFFLKSNMIIGVGITVSTFYSKINFKNIIQKNIIMKKRVYFTNPENFDICNKLINLK
jgi:hypothetical protein